jgi:hypothetical protein
MTDASPRHPVFIVGMPRSGTTLLSHLLHAHSAFSMLPETHFFTRCWTPGRRRRPPAPDRLLECLLRQPGVQDLGLSDAETTAARRRLRAAAEPDAATVLRALARTYTARSGAAAWGESTPDHLHHVPEILRQFPGARVLALVRDPRDVCRSLASVPWGPDTLPERAWAWRVAADRLRAHRAAHPDRVLCLRYEDLITAPAAALRSVCDALNCAFEPAMLRFHEHDALPVNVEREPWKAGSVRPIDPSNRARWRTGMPPADCAIVDWIVGARRDRFGYPPAPSPWSPRRMGAVLRRLGRAGGRILRRVGTRLWD